MKISKMKLKYSSLFFVPFMVMLGVFLCLGLTPFSQNSIHSGDFLAQYFPLYIGLHKLFWSGDFGGLFWSFEKSLGGAMPSVWGFNSLSPFTFLYVIFPVSTFQILSYVIPLIRSGIMGVVFGYFLEKKFQGVSKHYWLSLGLSSSYALSGFIVSQQYNPNFLDNLIYVPLILLGIEEIAGGKRSFKLPIFLSISLITNFYTGYMMCLFVALYTFYVVFSKKASLKDYLLKIGRVALFALIGVGIAAFWLLPVFSALLESKASAGSTFAWSWDFVNDVVAMPQKFILGSFGEKEWGDPKALPQLYIGGLALFGLFTFFAKKEITLLKKLSAIVVLLVLFLSFSIQGFDQIWHMGQRPVGFFFRNSWVANTFMLILASESLLQWKDKPRLSEFLVAIFGFGSILVLSTQRSLQFVETPQKILAFCFWATILLAFFFRKVDKVRRLQLVAGVVIIELMISSFVGFKRVPFFIGNEGLKSQMEYATAFDQEGYGGSKAFTRMEMHKGLSHANFPIAYNYNGVSHFTSSLEYSLIEELSHLGLPSSQSVVNYTSRNVILDSFFGISNFMMDGDEKRIFSDVRGLYEKVGTLKNFAVYRNPYAFSLGYLTNESSATNISFESNQPVANLNQLLQVIGLSGASTLSEVSVGEPVTSNLTKSEDKYTLSNEGESSNIEWKLSLEPNKLYFIEIPERQAGSVNKSKVKLNGLSYPYENRSRENQLWMLGNGNLDQTITLTFEEGKAKEWDLRGFKFYSIDIPTLTNALERFKKANDITIDSYSNSTVKAHVNVTNSEQSFATFTIPYHSGWSVTVDGQAKEVQKSLGFFMGVSLTEGEHEIVWSYSPPGLNTGIVLSMTSLIVLIYLWKKKKVE